MKVVILSLEYPPNVYGGVGAHVAGIARALSRHIEVEVRTLEARGPGGEERGRRPGGSLAVRRYRPGGLSEASKSLPFRPALEALALDLSILSDPMDCELVHSHTWYMNLAGALAKRLYGARAVATVHSLEPLRPWKEEQLGPGYALSRWMEEEGLGACDAVVAVSERMRRDLLRCYSIPRSRVHVVHNGIDPELWRPARDREALKRLGVREPYVLFVGRLTRQKGIPVLVEASKSFPPGTTTVLATGRPDEPGIVSELAKALRGRRDVVWLRGQLGRRELRALYSSASVSVTPSL